MDPSFYSYSQSPSHLRRSGGDLQEQQREEQKLRLIQQIGDRRAPSLRLQGRSMSARDSREDTYYHATNNQGGLVAHTYDLLQSTGGMSLRPQSSQKLSAPRILPATPQQFSNNCQARSPPSLSPTRQQEPSSPQQGLSRSPSNSTRKLPTVPAEEYLAMPEAVESKDHLSSKRKLFSHKLNGQWRSMGQNDSQMNSNVNNSNHQEGLAAYPLSTASVSFDFSGTDHPSGSSKSSGLPPSGNKTPSPRREHSPQAQGSKSARARASVTIRTDSTTSESGTLATSNHLSVTGEGAKVHESLSLNNLTKDGSSSCGSNAAGAPGSLPRRAPKKRSPASNSTRTNSSSNVISSSNKSSRESPSSKSTSSIKRPIGISSASQQIIGYCMDNAKGDIAGRVVARMAHKRDDFAGFCTNLSPENWLAFLNQFREYLMEVVKNLQRVEKDQRSINEIWVQPSSQTSSWIQADFFSIMADALITECVFLDGATHQPTEAIEAWSELVSGHMFSNIRDGYYQQIRYLRRNTQCFSSMFSHSSDQSTEGVDVPAAPANCNSTANGSNSTSCISVPNNK
uniref:Uncharacterized protein n=1 Tax=Ditylenchus dipsaci TaxID=166011 RepID=A0A915E6U2_9BILA